MGKLPAEIIHHIQSFMRGRDAARTSLLSKSWYGAWSTRPNLVFEKHDFLSRLDDFPEFTKKTMQRYKDLNLKINTLSLQMNGNHSLATELILKAIELGATDLTLRIQSVGTTSFVLPDEVLESETLASLSVNGFTVDLQRRRKKGVTCSNLKSLNISNATVNGDLFRDLISRCPLIEELTLDQTMSLFGGEKRRLSPFYDSAVKLHKLKYLHLEDLDFKDSLSRHDLWHKLCCLKELVIGDSRSSFKMNNVRICSRSLERISIRFYRDRIMNAEFDVPNIRKFKFEGYDLPRLEMNTSSRGWESDIHIYGKFYEANASWFSSLNVLVKMLSPSRVSLSIYVDVHNFKSRPRYVGDGLPIPAVENLTLYGLDVNPAFLDALFWSCRPNSVNIERCCALDMGKVNVEVFQQLGYLPRKTLLDDRKFVRFQLK